MTHRPLPPATRRALVALAALVALPPALLASLLYAQAQAAYPVLATRELGLHLLSAALGAALTLTPLAFWPLRTRGYAALAAVALAPLLAVNLVHVLEYGELISLGAIDAVANTTWSEAVEFATGRIRRGRSSARH